MNKLALSFAASISFLAPTFFPSPAHALPVWAELIAQSHCEYLAMGADWESAMRQALVDRKHWLSEVAMAGDLGNQSIVYAIQLRCPTMNNKAFEATKKSGVI